MMNERINAAPCRPTQSSLIYAYCTGATDGIKHTRKEAQEHFGVSQAWTSKALTVHCRRYGLPLVPDARVSPPPPT